MEDIYLDASKSTDSSAGNESTDSYASNVRSLEFNDVSGCLEENAICDSAGNFETVQTMRCDKRLYKKDIVQCRETNGLIGMVMKVAGGYSEDSDSTSSYSEDEDGSDSDCTTSSYSESESEDEEESVSEDEDEDKDKNDKEKEKENEHGDESTPDDSARIVWTDLSVTSEKISDIEVLDRVFSHGDFVAIASDP